MDVECEYCTRIDLIETLGTTSSRSVLHEGLTILKIIVLANITPVTVMVLELGIQNVQLIT